MVLILVIAVATQVHMTRMRLTHLADELAADAADALNVPEYYQGRAVTPEPEYAVWLHQERMEEAVLAHLTTRAVDQLEHVRVIDVYSEDGVSATVTVEVTVHPLWMLEPLLPFADGIQVRATGNARTF